MTEQRVANVVEPGEVEEVAVERERFRFADDPQMRSASRLFGIDPARAYVELVGTTLRARFGRWLVETPVENVRDATVTGPYSWPKVAGPPHLSFADRGLTFATTTRSGACLQFHEPVRGLVPSGLVRHPSLTVTVEDPAALVEAVIAARAAAPDRARDERDQLEARTAKELRDLARAHGIPQASTLKKADLVTALTAVLD